MAVASMHLGVWAWSWERKVI